ncbi:hydrogenase maturation protease [Calidifontimicrobium sp. SYSU G02091]|uniref:hydrogenase maturation protease n=1 Tax=Calidifontimicrobium sp. SYSU G02091 TaxID=2926421 RepID=UPI001F5383BB|nr:hydrogenase maturation protease [Calidifontimicrobium sp. SYSU G02091]
MAAPLLIVAVGNPSRGDDALGPALVERLRAAGVDADGTVELLVDFQLQVEHALDLVGRRAVLFVDAARPGTVDGVALQPVAADAAAPLWSHALRPQAVLAVYAQVQRQPPPAAWLLAIEGRDFALGEGLGDAARRRLDVAEAKVLDWLRERAGACAPHRVT